MAKVLLFMQFLKELLSGKKPYDWVSRPDLLGKVVSEQMPDPPCNTTHGECSTIMRALEHNPMKRYSSCRRFVSSLIPLRHKPVQFWISVAALVVLALAISGSLFSYVKKRDMERSQIAIMEEKAKKEKQRQEAENARRSNEAVQLQWRAKELLGEILSRNLDEGQTFGAHIKAAKEKYNEGEKAMGAGERAAAFDCFSESLENSEWIRNNAEIRNAVKILKVRVLGLEKNCADKSRELFPEEWKKASDKFQAGISSFEAGKFPEAEKTFKEAEEGFLKLNEEVKSFMKKQYVESAEKALQEQNWIVLKEYALKLEELDSSLGHKYLMRASNEIKKAQIASELALARKFKNEKAWEAVILHCQKVLELEGDNNDARLLHEEATLALTCNLRAVTMIEGEVVSSSVEINGESLIVKTNDLIRNLPFNTSNAIRFFVSRTTSNTSGVD